MSVWLALAIITAGALVATALRPSGVVRSGAVFGVALIAATQAALSDLVALDAPLWGALYLATALTTGHRGDGQAATTTALLQAVVVAVAAWLLASTQASLGEAAGLADLTVLTNLVFAVFWFGAASVVSARTGRPELGALAAVAVLGAVYPDALRAPTTWLDALAATAIARGVLAWRPAEPAHA